MQFNSLVKTLTVKINYRSRKQYNKQVKCQESFTINNVKWCDAKAHNQKQSKKSLQI